MTAAALADASARMANALVATGLARGDRVAVLAEKALAYLALYLGCLRAGFVFQPLNPTYTPAELAFFLGDAETSLLVHDPALAERVATACADCAVPPSCLTPDAAGQGRLAPAAAASSGSFTTVACAGDTLAALLYASGTTGRPKGIRITHDNLYSNARALVTAWGFDIADVLIHALPVFHVHGLFITLGPALLAGTRLRWLPRFEVDAVLAALPGATLFAGVPTYYSRLLAAADFTAAACRDMRLFISGSAPLPDAVFHAFAARTGHTILERYGMTETGINTSNPCTACASRARSAHRCRGGCASSTRRAGRWRGRNRRHRGARPNVFPGYWRLPEATARAFDAEGWFDTGDQGLLDADGYLHIVGRSKDLVISGGLNVYPKEVEREVEALTTVGEIAVFGVPHPDLGEAVVAAVETTTALDEAALIAGLRERLAGYKVPKRLFALDALPRNAMGKVQKNLLRERFRATFDTAVG